MGTKGRKRKRKEEDEGREAKRGRGERREEEEEMELGEKLGDGEMELEEKDEEKGEEKKEQKEKEKEKEGEKKEEKEEEEQGDKEEKKDDVRMHQFLVISKKISTMILKTGPFLFPSSFPPLLPSPPSLLPLFLPSSFSPGEELEEISESDFRTDCPTITVGSLLDADFIVQVVPSTVVVLAHTVKTQEIRAPSGLSFVSGFIESPYVVLRLSDDSLLLYEAKKSKGEVNFSFFSLLFSPFYFYLFIYFIFFNPFFSSRQIFFGN